MTRAASLLSALITSSLLGLGAARASLLCPWTRVLAGGELHLSFLRQDSPSARLYHSAWSGEARALLGCAWSDSAAVTEDYLSLCLERAQDFSSRPDEGLDLDSVFGALDRCVPLEPPAAAQFQWRTGSAPVRKRRRRSSSSSAAGLPQAQAGQGHSEGSEVRDHPRVKRGFIVPGTLWCGSGNKAPSYADLGVFAETDSCCREHDQCKHTILSFHSDFGVFNSNIFTLSHCDCDNRFRTCLKEASDRISDVVGYTFFNLLKMHCFKFSHQLQCTQRNWFGMCKETKMALYAEVHPPELYESSDPTEADVNSTSSINSTAPADPELFSITAAESTVPTPLTGSPSASIAPGTDVPRSTDSDSAGPEVSAPETPPPAKNQTEPDAETLPCGVFKDLDVCRDKILPQQRRFGLHNAEARTLYHCNCTSRLFQTLVKQRQLSEVQVLLLGSVSPSCFLPQDCRGKTCSAVLVKPDLPQLEPRSSTEVEEQRHLQLLPLKLRRPMARRASRKEQTFRLHKLCLRLTRRRQSNKSRKRTGNAQRTSRPETVSKS